MSDKGDDTQTCAPLATARQMWLFSFPALTIMVLASRSFKVVEGGCGMAKKQSAEEKLRYAAATVHTYESFGRAIVAAALAASSMV